MVGRMGHLLRRYSRFLDEQPYLAHAITAGCLWGAGDFLSQTLSHRHHLQELQRQKSIKGRIEDATAQKQGDIHKKELSYLQAIDWKRLGLFASFGVCAAGPLYAFWYRILDKVVTKYLKSPINVSIATKQPMFKPIDFKWKVAAYKVIADLILFDPPFIALVFVTMNTALGIPWHETKQKMQNDFIGTYLWDVKIWTPIQLANFRFVPVTFQPVFVNSVNIFWNAFLSHVQKEGL